MLLFKQRVMPFRQSPYLLSSNIKKTSPFAYHPCLITEEALPAEDIQGYELYGEMEIKNQRLFVRLL